MEVAAPPSNPGLAEQFMHKNHLQEYAQKSAIPLPLYQTVNEGYPHAPQFRSTVIIDGATFRSPRTFAHRKEAEQDVAKLALESLSRRIKYEGVPLIYEDPIFCKSILHEYAVKMNLGKPAYTTSRSEGTTSVFISSLVFDGNTYTGAGNNKKVAEQMAARTVIESVLANSNSRTLMSQIIKSKGKLYAAHRSASSKSSQEKNLALKMYSPNISSDSKGNEVQANLTNDKLPVIAYSEAWQLGKAAETLSLPPEAKKPKDVYICEPSSGSAGSDTSLPTLPEGDLPTGATRRVFKTNDESYLAECDDGIPLADPATQPCDSQGVVPDIGRKRLRKDQGIHQSTKIRADERLPPAEP